MNNAPTNASQPRPAKFTETWYATESLFNRTHERNRAMNAPGSNNKPGSKPGKRQGYEAINRRYDSDSESDYENEGKSSSGGYRYRNLMSPDADEVDDGDLGSSQPPQQHPNPLRSNPSLPSIAGTGSDVGSRPKSMPGPALQQGTRRPHTPFLRKSSALSEIDLNDRRVSGGNAPSPTTNTTTKNKGGDISDEKPYGNLKPSPSKRYTWAPMSTTAASAPRNRDSSIQPESDFYSKPYGELKSATPPLIVGSDRQVSSGNDYGYLGAANDGPATTKRNFSIGKRNVSGKVAEEGRGIGWAR